MNQCQPGLSRSENGIDCVFPASTENVELFIAGLHDFLAEKNLGGLAFDMELLARESLGNAVQHGSLGDSSRTIQASLRLDPGMLVLVVRDEGPGWDWRNMTTTPADPVRETGRGLFIIRKYADSFFYNDKGNALTITRRVPPEDQDMDTPKDSTVRMPIEHALPPRTCPPCATLFAPASSRASATWSWTSAGWRASTPWASACWWRPATPSQTGGHAGDHWREKGDIAAPGPHAAGQVHRHHPGHGALSHGSGKLRLHPKLR